MEALNGIQEDTKSKIMKSRTNFKKAPKDRLTLPYIETRLEIVEQQWQLFNKTHVQIISEIKKPEILSSNYHKDNVYDEVEELYIQFKSELKVLLLKMSSDTLSGTVNSSCVQKSVVKLPEIKIPIFSGKYMEWQTFRDLFMGLIHKNKSLDDAQKLYYLKGHLTGEAEQLLRNINVTAENYKGSWEKLESMYNNKRFLANGILKRLLNQRTLTFESANDIKKLLSTTSDCLESVKNLGVDVSSWDILIIHLISAKLDRESRKAWEFSISSDPADDLPTFVQFYNFLTGRFRGLENVPSVSKDVKSSQSFLVENNKEVSCVYCGSNHKLYICKKFCKESNDTRREFARTRGLCFICLNNNHSARSCKSNFKCQICKSRHHTLLHPSNISESAGGSSSVNDVAAIQVEGSTDQQVVSCHSTNKCRTVLLTTALVKAKSKDGTFQVIRALLDQGSQGSFITEATVQYLGLKKTSSKHTVKGVGGNNNLLSKSTVTLTIQSRVDPYYSIQINAYVLKSITSLLPAVTTRSVECLSLTIDQYADPDFNRPNKIDILLGAEIYSQIIKEGIQRSANGLLLAQDTTFGWILSGVVKTNTSSSTESFSGISVMHASIQDDDLLKKFWELEAEPTVTKKILSEEEVKCEQFFSATTIRNENGRYVVRLPFKDGVRSCKNGDSRAIAERRLKGLEFKLAKNIQLKVDYTKVIHEYTELNHMVKVTQKGKNSGLYLPHHAVIRNDKETTKVRVVFDASCKGKNGVSLNDNLMVGPTLQADLRHIVMRWRRHPICIVADIVKMYRQVLVNREDTKFQRILWRDSPDLKIEEHELITVTFGTASAPFLAVRALHQIAYDECQEPSATRKIILNDFYMDDLMTGAENAEEGYKIYCDMKTTLAKGGFQLQKWVSNSIELLHKVKEGKRDKDEDVTIKVDSITKILGLTWDPCADVFQYTVDLPALVEPVTKRKMISDISRLFDPLGWLAPSIILAKIMIQKLWLSGISWDQEVPSHLLKEWHTYRCGLGEVVNIKIPRWLHTRANDIKVELHGFSDASQIAYAAVVYMRVVDAVGNITVALITSKTKVSPIKQVSIPRLELCAAVLLTKLMIEVANLFHIGKADLHAWTDSEIVLAWLNSHPNRWKTFVANRVSEILTALDTQHWAHVSSKQNPADCASRGVSPVELASNAMWFDGPNFLKSPVIEYNRPKHLLTKLEEVKVHKCVVDDSFLKKYSSLQKLVRVVAYCRRFLNLRSGIVIRNCTTYLSTEEIEDAFNICIKKAQEEEYLDEIKDLKNKGFIDSKKSRFKSLNLFMDSREIIRVGGRLERSQLDYDRKHPILLSKNSFLTNLLIADAHAKTLHGGPQAMITYLRTKYWIIGMKTAVKAYFHKCVRCVRYSSKIRAQLMGQLPSFRVTPNKPFLYTGVDYAGPINIRVSKGRGNKSYKGYIALFICMSTRAIHLEAVSDMTSKGFLAAFRRFVARRGRCAELHSDNGSNFVGAARELQALFDEAKSKFVPELAEYLANNGTQWSFIPPHAPNFGGLWEAGVKSTKHHLKRVVGNSTLTFEEMSTVLAQIEACLNSRPLTYVDDPNETVVLTPGHFLVGEPLILVPDKNVETLNVNSLKRWQLSQRMLQDFWRRWSQDYLNQFLQRHKWAYQTPEPDIGSIVLIKEDDMPPGKWLLGRIEQKHPGSDQITRVITVRTKNSVVKRSISKVCVLPIAN